MWFCQHSTSLNFSISPIIADHPDFYGPLSRLPESENLACFSLGMKMALLLCTLKYRTTVWDLPPESIRTLKLRLCGIVLKERLEIDLQQSRWLNITAPWRKAILSAKTDYFKFQIATPNSFINMFRFARSCSLVNYVLLHSHPVIGAKVRALIEGLLLWFTTNWKLSLVFKTKSICILLGNACAQSFLKTWYDWSRIDESHSFTDSEPSSVAVLVSGIWYPIFFHLTDLLAQSQAAMSIFIPLSNAWLELYLKSLGSSVLLGQLWSLVYFILIIVLSIHSWFVVIIIAFILTCFESGLLNLVRACLFIQRYSRNLHLFGMINIHKGLLCLQLFLSVKHFNVEFIPNISIILE